MLFLPPINTLAIGIALSLPSAFAHFGLPGSFEAKSCFEYKIDLSVESDTFIWNRGLFKNNYDVVNLIIDLTSRDTDRSNPLTGPVKGTTSGIIAATFCTPVNANAAKKDIILLATHGLNYDKNYWNPAFEPEKYNFVDHAIGEGYSVFIYDRIGVGESSRISGYVAQTTIQLAILQHLIKLIHSGKYTANIGKPKAIVLVGHSFGSILSAAAITAEPFIAEAVILTGFSYNGTSTAWFDLAAGLRIANGESYKYRSFDNGYITPIDIYADATTFFHAPGYDVAALEWADKHKMPIGIAELTSLMTVNSVANTYTGVAMILTGQFDFIFCQSQCDDLIEYPAAEIFKHAKAFKAVSFPGAGHGVNFAKNAREAFGLVTDFLDANGL